MRLRRRQFRMDLVGTDERGRICWRGTGFDPDPGGLTWISEADLRKAMVLFSNWLAENDEPVVWVGPSGVLH